MSQTTLRTLLELANIGFKERGTNVGYDHININCLECRDYGFHCGVHEEKLFFHCWKCGAKGSWYKLRQVLFLKYPTVDWYQLGTARTVKFLDTLPAQRTRQDLTEYFRPFHGFGLDLVAGEDLAPMRYLVDYPEEFSDPFRSRGLDPALLPYIRPTVGINKLRGHVVFPSQNEIVARRYEEYKDYPRWWKSEHGTLFGLDHAINLNSKWIVLSEGLFDALAVPLGYGVALQGTQGSDKKLTTLVEALPDLEVVVVALDKGVADRLINPIRFILSDLGVDTLLFDWEDDRLAYLTDLDEVRLELGPLWLQSWVEDALGETLTSEELLI